MRGLRRFPITGRKTEPSNKNSLEMSQLAFHWRRKQAKPICSLRFRSKLYISLELNCSSKAGHFSRTIAKGPDTTTWIWNLHADAHDFDSHTSDLEEISRTKSMTSVNSPLSFAWLSGMYFHGARFSNYEAWLSDPTHIGPSAQVVWPIVGQEILNGNVRVWLIKKKTKMDGIIIYCIYKQG